MLNKSFDKENVDFSEISNRIKLKRWTLHTFAVLELEKIGK